MIMYELLDMKIIFARFDNSRSSLFVHSFIIVFTYLSQVNRSLTFTHTLKMITYESLRIQMFLFCIHTLASLGSSYNHLQSITHTHTITHTNTYTQPHKQVTSSSRDRGSAKIQEQNENVSKGTSETRRVSFERCQVLYVHFEQGIEKFCGCDRTASG